jgi:hypothetical protein
MTSTSDSADASSWTSRYNELVDFHSEFGSCVVLANNPLSVWVSHQRQCFQKGELSRDQIAKLMKLGFDFHHEASDNHNHTANSNSRKRLAKSSVDILKKWYDNHNSNPYPTEDDRNELAEATGMTHAQVKHWFKNRRKKCGDTGTMKDPPFYPSEAVACFKAYIAKTNDGDTNNKLYPSKTDKQQLANQTGLPIEKVTNWFTAERARLKSSGVNISQVKSNGDTTIRQRVPYSKEAIRHLKSWFNEHVMNPYPTKEEKRELSTVTGLSVERINTWQRRKKAISLQSDPK